MTCANCDLPMGESQATNCGPCDSWESDRLPDFLKANPSTPGPLSLWVRWKAENRSQPPGGRRVFFAALNRAHRVPDLTSYCIEVGGAWSDEADALNSLQGGIGRT